MTTVYFQRQNVFNLYCGLHSLNNLIGSKTFTIDQLDNICEILSPNCFINPHKHIFGGEYDVNVLMFALQNLQYQTLWHDKRKQFCLSQYEKQSQVLGLLINIKLPENILQKIFNIQPRHWISVKKLGNDYYILDSKQEQYVKIGDFASTQCYLNKLISQQDSEVILVYKKNINQQNVVQ